MRDLDRYPKRRKKASSPGEKQEDSLAQRISKRWKDFVVRTQDHFLVWQLGGSLVWQLGVAAWWANAGINLKPVIPTYCTDVEDAKRKRGGVSVELSHYLLSHVLLRDVWSFVNDGTHLAFEDLPQKQTFFEFFSFCWPQSLRQSFVRQQFTLC